MEDLERDIEKKLIKLIKTHGGLCLKWVCPGWSGVPDRMCLLPGGRLIFVETKRPKGGRKSEMQKYWSRTLKRLGFPHMFCYNEADIAYIGLYIDGVDDL